MNSNVYVISYDNVGLVLCSILFFVQYFMYDRNSANSRFFRFFVGSACIECLLDMITAQNIDGRVVFADMASIILNTLYFFATIFTAFIGFKMAAARVGFKNKYVHYLAEINLVVGAVMLVINIFTGFLFTVKDQAYIKTPAFMYINVSSFVFFALIPIVIAIKHKSLESDERLAPVIFVVVLFTSFVLQFIFPKVLLNGLGKALSALAYMLILETPEHMRVKKAVAELKTHQQKELAAIEALSKANEEKTSFLISTTHALRTPINAIMGFSEIIQRDFDTSGIKNELAKLDGTIGRLLYLVDNMVDFAQIEIGKLDIAPMEYEVAGAYLEFIDYVEKRADSDKFKLSVEFSKDLPKKLYGDEKRIFQVNEILCSFFSEYGMQTEVFVEMKLDRIDWHTAYLEFSIRNSEIQIPKEELDAILAFKQKFMGSEECYASKEMNLLMARKILESMDGELVLNVSEERGFEFKYTIPQEIVDLKAVGEKESALEAYKTKLSSRSKKNSFIMPKARILIVDDNAVNLRVLQGLLRPYQAQVTPAQSGEEALEIMKQKEFDLVLLDILMPGMDGSETLAHIRTDEGIISSSIDVIAFTANVFSGAKDFYEKQGFADYVTKPVKGERIALALKTFLPELMEEEWTELSVTDEEDQ